MSTQQTTTQVTSSLLDKAVLLFWKGPSQDNIMSYTLYSQRDTLTIQGTLNAVKKYLMNFSKEFDEEIRPFLYRYNNPRVRTDAPKIIYSYNVVRRGPVSRPTFVISINIISPLLYRYIVYAKGFFSNFVTRIGVRVPATSLVLVPGKYFEEVYLRLREANLMLNVANEYYKQFYEKVRPGIYEIFDKFHLDAELPEKPKEIHEIEVYVFPIDFSGGDSVWAPLFEKTRGFFEKLIVDKKKMKYWVNGGQ